MRNVTLQTMDRQQIAVAHHESGFRKAVILAHGFFNAKDAFLFREIAVKLSQFYDVVSFDFRGHGKSSGLFTWTSRECADLHAVITYARKSGYTSIGLVGFSLGAAISLIETAQNPDVTSVLAISPPYDFWKIDYHFWRRSMWRDLLNNMGHKGRGKGVRPGHPWEPKISPIDIVERIAPRPVMFLHGAKDWVINVRHSRLLYIRAKEPKRLVVLDRLGHAESMFDQDPEAFMQPCLEWLAETL